MISKRQIMDMAFKRAVHEATAEVVDENRAEIQDRAEKRLESIIEEIIKQTGFKEESSDESTEFP